MSADKDEWDTDDSDNILPSDSGFGEDKAPERNRDLKQHNGGVETKPLERHWTKKFPFSVFFIVGNEFCERFSYYGMRAVLVLFLTHQLGFGDDSATALYHAFIMLCYLLPLMGAIISDSCLGKYGTILSLSVVYAIGNVVVSVSAIPFNNATGANIALAAVGLVVIAMGTGGIKPCVSAFGGDQFTENDQEKYRQYFFSLFYFSINAGSVISTLLTPILRDDINCFDTGECFALAFGVPAVLMIISLVIFIVGTRFYVILKPKKESARLFLDVPLCISSAVYRRIKHGRISGKTHWLQYASPKYSATFIEDVRLVLRVLVMFLPLPIFWTLFDQQGSRWTLQAVRMNGELGTVAVKPDQMQALNPILILVLIPIFEFGIYPLAARVHLLKRPLQRMVVGMVIAGVSFMVAGFVQISVQNADTSLSSGHAKIVVINSSPDPVNTHIFGQTFNLSSAETFSRTTGDLGNQVLCVTSDLSSEDPCGSGTNFTFSLSSQYIVQLVVYGGGQPAVAEVSDKEDLPDGGKSSFRVINTVVSEPYVNFTLYTKKCNCSLDSCGDQAENVDLDLSDISNVIEVDPGRYYYCARPASNGESYSARFETGGIYTIVLGVTENNKYSGSVVELHAPNSVSLFLQVPMYVIITVGEVLFSISGLEFAYSQAPVSMKSLCQAAWLWTVAFGNLFVIIIAEGRIFENQALEFFFFAACIGAVAILFAVMSFFYKYVDLSTYDQLQEGGGGEDDTSSDETKALILSHNKDKKQSRENDEKGDESEF